VNPQMDPQMGPRRLYRSADDRILAGVAGGLAAYFDIDPVIVRIVWFLSVFFTGSLTFWVYLIMIVVVPPEPVDWAPQAPWSSAGSPSFQAVYTPPAADAAGTSTTGALKVVPAIVSVLPR
jgi:phage shock protein PspC (stress-responsive transcriptional regulator)